MRMRPGAVPPPGQGVALDPLAVVRAAMAGEPVTDVERKRLVAGGEFSMTTVSPALRQLGTLYAVYLCFNALRVQEVITVLAVPKLPMIMSLAIAAGLALGVPAAGWKALWVGVPALRWQALITLLAIVTIPLGIWMGNSLDRLYPGYFIVATLFVAGVVVLRDRAVLTRTLQILTGVLTLIAVLVFLGVGAGTVGAGRLSVGASLDPNDYAWILATFVPIALWLGVRKKATALLWFGAAAVLAMGIVPTQSRGGFLALLSSGVVLILLGARGWRRVLLFLCLGSLGALILAYINATGASRLTDFSGYEGGTGRVDLWKQGIEWMIARPWGYGLGNYETYNTLLTRSAHGAHSSYIGIGVELGVLGGIAFIAIWVGVLKGLYRLRALALDATGDATSRESAAMYGFLLSALVANMVGSAFLNTQYAALTLFMQAMGTAVLVRGSQGDSLGRHSRVSQLAPALRASTAHPRVFRNRTRPYRGGYGQ